MAADFVLNSGNAGSKHPLLLRRLAWTCSVVDVPVLDQPVSAHPQSRAWAGSTPFRPKGPGQFGGLGSRQGSPPGGRPTFTQLARTTGTISTGTVTRIAPGPAAGGSGVPTVAINFHVEPPPTRYRSGGEFYDSGVAGPVVKRAALRSGETPASLSLHPPSSVSPELYPPSKLGLSSAAGRGALGQFELDSRREQSLPSQQQFAAFQADPLCAGRSRIAFNDFARALRPSVAEQAPE